MRGAGSIAGLSALPFAASPGLAASPGEAAGGDATGRGADARSPSSPASSPPPVTVERVDTNFEREPLVRPLGFKGGYLSELWQSVGRMESSSGACGIGLGTQSVLWSDSDVFGAHSESGGNTLMYALTERGLQVAEGTSFETPIDLLDRLFPEVYEYGKTVTRNPDLRETFALNALVPVDNAAWMLYARENGVGDFDALVPDRFRPALSHRHDAVASVPTVAYSVPLEDVERAAREGTYIFKIKIGQPGTQSEMLRKDSERMTAIHERLAGYETPHTESGRLQYYIDANGRYQEKETLQRFVDHLREIGAFEQTLVVEEPFPEDEPIQVGDLGVNIAADESAHTAEDVRERIEMGYGSIALKPIAKTMSMTLRMARLAHEEGMPCFCADLTVNPILVDWNKSFAARLDPFPGLDTGMMETNGHQNYADWERMRSYHPYSDAPWTRTQNGVFRLTDDFYEKDGGILTESKHYRQMFAEPSG